MIKHREGYNMSKKVGEYDICQNFRSYSSVYFIQTDHMKPTTREKPGYDISHLVMS